MKLGVGIYMKDLPHHIKKLNRKIIRSANRENHKEEQELLIEEESSHRSKASSQKKKKAKQAKKAQEEKRVPHPETPETKNEMEKHRTPVRKPRSHQPPKKPNAKSP